MTSPHGLKTERWIPNNDVWKNYVGKKLDSKWLEWKMEPKWKPITVIAEKWVIFSRLEFASWLVQRWTDSGGIYLELRSYHQVSKLGGGFKIFLCSPRTLGKISNLTNIFQLGWNHQLVKVSNARQFWSPFSFEVLWLSLRECGRRIFWPWISWAWIFWGGFSEENLGEWILVWVQKKTRLQKPKSKKTSGFFCLDKYFHRSKVLKKVNLFQRLVSLVCIHPSCLACETVASNIQKDADSTSLRRGFCSNPKVHRETSPKGMRKMLEGAVPALSLHNLMGFLRGMCSKKEGWSLTKPKSAQLLPKKTNMSPENQWFPLK